MPTLSNVTSPYFTLKRSVPPHPAPHDSSSWARKTAKQLLEAREDGSVVIIILVIFNRKTANIFRCSADYQIFFRLSSDVLQMFFGFFSDFLQIIFRLSSDYLEIIFGKRNMQGVPFSSKWFYSMLFYKTIEILKNSHHAMKYCHVEQVNQKVLGGSSQLVSGL